MKLVSLFFIGFLLTTVSSVQAQESPLVAATARADKAEAMLKYKDFQLAAKDLDNLMAQFEANESVKAVRAKIEALRKELAALEEARLKAAGLKKDEFYLDFTTGDLKPVAPPAKP